MTSRQYQLPRKIDDEPFGQVGIRRYIFPALSSSSLTLMVLSMAMWVRSHYVIDSIRFDVGSTEWTVKSTYGRILAYWEYDPSAGLRGETWNYTQEPLRRPVSDLWRPSIYKRLGLEWRNEHVQRDSGADGGWLRIRWPLIVVLAGLLPLARVVRERRARRAKACLARGQCPRCGAELLRGLSRCPECGDTLELD